MAVRKEILATNAKNARRSTQKAATKNAIRARKNRYSPNSMGMVEIRDNEPVGSGRNIVERDIGKLKSAGAGGGRKTRMGR